MCKLSLHALFFMALLVPALTGCPAESQQPSPTPAPDQGVVDQGVRDQELDQRGQALDQRPGIDSHAPDQGELDAADEEQDSAGDLSDGDLGPSCLAPASDDVNREGDAADGWRWHKVGRVFAEVEGVAPNDGDFAPSLIEEGEEGYRLYFARKRALAYELHTATSEDGVSWSEAVKVEGIEGTVYPSALRHSDGSVELWGGSGTFNWYRSEDGVEFEQRAAQILKPSQAGEFGRVSLTYPTVRRAQEGEEGYRMWFTGFSGQSYSIGEAFSEDGESWTVRSQEPVLEARGGEGYDSAAVSSPQAYFIDGVWHLWHSGYDTSNTNPGPWRIALATSEDGGRSWTRRGVSVALAEEESDSDDMWSTREPAVIPKRDGSGWLMVYVGMKDDGRYRLLTAESSVCSP